MAKKSSGRIIGVFLCLYLCLFLSGRSVAEPQATEPVQDISVDMPPEVAPDIYPVDQVGLGDPIELPEDLLSEEEFPSENISEESEVARPEGISLDLRGIDIIEFFKVLSKNLNKNIIPSKRVTGKLNLFLNNITYQEAFEVTMISQGLAYEERGKDIIMVMTEAEYETLYGEKFNEKRQMKTIKLEHAQPKMVFNTLGKLKSKVGNIIVDEVTGTVILIDIPDKLKSMEEIIKNLDEPLQTEAFELQYANAVDIQEGISSIVTPGSGSVLADERTNSIIVKDLPGNIGKIAQAIRVLDQETRQVFIEAEIIEITLRDRTQTGINWERIVGGSPLADHIVTATFPTAALSSSLRMVGGTLDKDKITVTMDFLNTIGDTRILSRPKIAVTNNEEAAILVGEKRAYVTGTTSQSGESTITSDSVEFVDVGIKLKVVPTINRDGFVTMKIKPEISSVTDTLTTGSEDEPRSIIPIITTSEAETTVKVKDGATIMIAGLRKTENTRDFDGIPYFSKIPIVNLLFSSRNSDQRQTEIVVFLTPYIITGEDTMPWDARKMKEYPDHIWTEKASVPPEGFKKEKLKSYNRSKR